MSICPNCETVNQAQALICSSCGFNLATKKQKLGEKLSSDQIGGIPTRPLDQSIVEKSDAIGEAILAFKFIRQGDIMPLVGMGDFILGRVSEGQTILPDLDLGPYEALETGVSRIHALIHISSNGVAITDLGSSNGTYINEKVLEKHVQHKVENKDMIRLGRLQMQAIMKS